ncbi:MAG TPA: glycerate kinase, partial [Chitinophagaceae bacterium]|nr:glycerate kinase [Chitinophagaceae bacterium]
FPVADGGDGTAGLLIDHLNGEWIHTNVHDPFMRKIHSSFGWIEKDKTAIIELAAASGLRLLKPAEYSPLTATTTGTGELILKALEKKAIRIILCVGGSATVDGGTGILKALGIKFYDENRSELNDLPAALSSLAEIDTTNCDRRMKDTRIIILCDVANPLLGPNGAATMFAPQKGASETEVELLESQLAKFNDIVLYKMGKDMSAIRHGGAAGGVAAGLHTFFNAELVNGIDYFLKATGFEKELAKANMVITGEGSIDLQTLQGKGPFGVAKKAKELLLPVIGMTGRVSALVDKTLQQYFDQLISINDNEANLETAIKNTFTNLEKASQHFGDLLSDAIVQN